MRGIRRTCRVCCQLCNNALAARVTALCRAERQSRAIEVTMTGPVIVTSMARDWRSALHSAVARAAKALLHNWQKTRQVRRMQRPVLTAAPSVS